MNLRCLTLLAVTCLFLPFGSAVSLATPQESDAVQVERQPKEGLILIRIPAVDGKVAWEDVLRALLRVAQLEDNALQGKFPSGSLDLQRGYSRYSLIAINLALAPDIRMRIESGTDSEPAHLLVTVDEAAVQQRKRRWTKKLRDRVADDQSQQQLFGLRLPPELKDAAPDQALVIVLHGFNSSPERFAPLVAALKGEGMLSAAYSYPDDQPIADSGVQLSTDLKKLLATDPDRPVWLVTHSMGGLVARSMLEQPDLDPGNVRKLIMIAPPTHGSLLAQFAFGLDILDHATGNTLPKHVTAFYAAVEDGLSEARTDLKPDSPFLSQLNARPRNPRVRYSIFLGTGGHLQQSQVDGLRRRLEQATQQSTTLGLIGPRLVRTLADLDEVVEGKGDGVVAVKRGRLAGVDDTVLADFSHLSVLQDAEHLQDDPVYRGVLERLKQ